MGPESVLAVGWAGSAAVMAGLWAVQRRTSDAGIVDVGWAALLGALAVLYAAVLDGGLPARRWLVAAVAGAWSARLAGYLLVDRVVGGEEDGRYQALRAHWGERAQPWFFAFFQAQALLAAILSVEFVLVMLHPAGGLRVWDGLGAAIVLGSVVGETVADRQLARFRSDPANRGRTCRQGLWRYSRHPNYFFEWLHWLAYPVFAIGAPWWWATLFAPALMYVFIRYLTGIPATERHALESRGDDYRRYQATTNALVPWFPREVR